MGNVPGKNSGTTDRGTAHPTPPLGKQPSVPNPRNGNVRNSSKVTVHPESEYSFNDSFSDVEVRDSLYTASERRALCHKIFSPPKGQLEVLLCDFISRSHYVYCGLILSQFLKPTNRELWFVDTPTLAYLGERDNDLVELKESISKERTNAFIRRRNEALADLREQLLIASGTAKEGKRMQQSLGTVLDLCRVRNSMASTGSTGSYPGSPSSQPASTRQRSKAVAARLEAKYKDSFVCLGYLANCIRDLVPAEFLLHNEKLLEYCKVTTPIVSKLVAYEEKRIGELDTMNFFVSLSERAKIVKSEGRDDLGIHTGSELYSSMRNLNLVINTACSSMVLYVLDNLANVINLRQRYRDHIKATKTKKKMTYEEIVNQLGGFKRFNGVAGDDVEEWTRFVVTDEMSLTNYTNLLVKKFRKDTKPYLKNIPAGEMGAAVAKGLPKTVKEEDIDYLQVVMSVFYKISYVIGGGQRSIQADDQRFNVNPNDINNDVWLSRMLESPILGRICWVPYMLGMPIMASKNNIYNAQARPLTFEEVTECSGVMRELFQAVGALPVGDSCPRKFNEWIPMFPLHALNVEGKRILTNLFVTQLRPTMNLPLSLPQAGVLVSLGIQMEKEANDKRRICYFFQSKEQLEKKKRKQERLDQMADQLSESMSQRSMMSISPSKRTVQYASVSAAPNQYSGYDYKSLNNSNSFTSDGEDSMSSISTLFDADAPIDIYSCISVQSQIYLKCANEITARRQRQTIISPYSKIKYYGTSSSLAEGRSDLKTVLRFMPKEINNNEAYLTVKWTGQPLVRFLPSDLINIIPESHLRRGMKRTSSGESDMSQAIVTPQQEEKAAVDHLVRVAEKNEPATSATSCWVVKEVYNIQAMEMGNFTSTSKLITDNITAASPKGKGKSEELILLLKFSGGCFIDDKSKIINVGHQHASVSPSFMLDGTNVSWSNPMQTIEENDKQAEKLTGKASNRNSVVSIDNGLALTETESLVAKSFYAFGILLGNCIPNGVYFPINIAPMLFYIIKTALMKRDKNMVSVAWFTPYEGNLLSASYLFTRADEILSMSDERYLNFLRTRNLDKEENLLFRVVESIADENTACRQAQSSDGLRGAGGRTKDNSVPRYLDSYVEALQERNRKGFLFGNQQTVPLYSRVNNSSNRKTSSLPPIDRSRGVSSVTSGTTLSAEDQGLLSKLPSRQEYVSLYLVNEIVWGAVDRDGIGAKNHYLWSMLLRGFNRSLVCECPLVNLCSARVLKDVLCIGG